MKGAAMILLLNPAAAQWKCLPDKPTSIGDLMRKWQTIDKTTRPNLAARSAEIMATAEGDGEPPVAAAEDVYVSLQVNKLIAVDTKAQTVTTDKSLVQIPLALTSGEHWARLAKTWCTVQISGCGILPLDLSMQAAVK